MSTSRLIIMSAAQKSTQPARDGSPPVRRPISDRIAAPLDRMMQAAPAGGLVLLVCAAIALVWANSPWAHGYRALWDTPLSIGFGSPGARLTLQAVVNDGLMAVFFFFVGLEIKREVVVGELATLRRAALPVLAALGGMVVPALLFVALNATTHGTRGWGVPVATDIAFALGVLALVGDRIPSSLRVFLSALAIADDLGAVLVIALFYTATISLIALAAAAVLLALSIALNTAGVRAIWVYALIGIALWIAVLLSGVHPTVAGVLLAFAVPSRVRPNKTAAAPTQSPLARLEHGLRVPVTFGIMPLFALANAGVSLRGGGHLLSSPVALGVIVGLFLGKPIGISLAAWAAVRSGIATVPADVSRRMLFGVAWLGGIGFTMSLFIASLAFGASPELLTAAKLGTFTASILAGTAGWLVLRHATRPSVGESDGHAAVS
ncbi:MAG TPA: Na+/H+ antiporter NhaA [Gemmatimonadaceae bacterium]